VPECVVYWLFDDKCVCPWRHGYVGISRTLTTRLRRHRATRRSFEWKILFKGSLEQCLKLERVMRPVFGIGWNEAPGGEYGGGSAPKKESTKRKMSDAALRRYQDQNERARMQKIVKNAFIGIDRTGPNNSHYGRSLSDDQRMRISVARTGKGVGNQNWKKRKPFSEEATRKMSDGAIKRWGRIKVDSPTH
jgi:hypothetical protein